MSIKRIYLSGKMRGIRDFNFPAFHAAAAKLREQGHVVFNPAEYDELIYGEDFSKSETGDLADIPTFDLRAALMKDLEYICNQATAIALLPGWESSKGALAELAVAKVFDLEIIMLPEQNH